MASVYWERPRRFPLEARLGAKGRTTLRRHAVVGAFAALVTLGFEYAFSDLPPARAWNRALADASLVLFGLTAAAGALVRLGRGRTLFALRRELGLWAAFLAIAHVLVVVGPWLGFETGALVREAGPAMGNLVGVVALAHALLLAATSNDVAQRRLGSSWTHLQRGAVTCYVLVALHTAYFLFLHPWTGDEAGYAPEGMRGPFLAGVAVLVALRALAFVKVAAREVRRTAE